ncbi:MAG TPA: hypothetical protein DCZ88_09215 [Pseudanabaena sp.]|nr:hypothetical protein [Pseudanabaena sp.]
MHNMMATDLKTLETVSDRDFDKEFLAEMIPHHKMALMMNKLTAIWYLATDINISTRSSCWAVILTIPRSSKPLVPHPKE